MLHPHVVLKFLFPVTNTFPHSRAHFAKSQGSGSAVLVVVRLLVVVVRVVIVCVEAVAVVTVAVVLDSVTDVLVPVTVVRLDDVNDVPVELVTEVAVVAVTVLVVGSPVVVVDRTSVQLSAPRLASSGHSVVSNDVHVSVRLSHPHSDTRHEPSLACAKHSTLLSRVCRHAFEQAIAEHLSGTGYV